MPAADAIRRYAQVLLHVGVRVGPGDRVLVTTPENGLDLAHELAEEAYRSGAVNVDVLIADRRLRDARLRYGSPEAHSEVGHHAEALRAAAERADSSIRLIGDDQLPSPGIDPAAVRVHGDAVRVATAVHMAGALSLRFPWTIAGVPGPRWAQLVFPQLETAEAVEQLWDAVLRTAHVHEEDPLASWGRHVDELLDRARRLDDERFDRLRYHGPGTDLVVGLARGHRWAPPCPPHGSGYAVANIPTEEVPTAPDRDRGEGTVAITKPFSLGGELVRDLRLRLHGGEVVEAEAAGGQDAVDELLATPGARRLGEVSLVPMSSRVAREQLVWWNTLFDENDASHIALGMGLPPFLEGGAAMSASERIAAGLNQSSVHVDMVVGSRDLDVFGVRADGSEVPLLVAGEWADRR